MWRSAGSATRLLAARHPPRRGRCSEAPPSFSPAAMLPLYQVARKPNAELYAACASRFPYADSFEIRKGLCINADAVIGVLSPLLTDERLARFDAVCRERTFNVLPIVEGMYDMGNLAAVCRSADALGCGAVHVIRGEADRYKQSKRTSGGSEKWLDVRVFGSTEECLSNAKRMGFQIVATHLRADAIEMGQVDWRRPTAFVLGNEKAGVSDAAVKMADACAVIPITGFVESYNVRRALLVACTLCSVASALVMWEARRQRLEKLGYHGDLSPEEQHILKAALLLRHKGATPRHIELLLAPPLWQQHRGGMDWSGKEFVVAAAAVAAAGPPPSPPLKHTCHYWNGQQCFGETYLWPGKVCRYRYYHLPGLSTLDPYKLQLECGRRRLPNPVDLDAPPPPADPERAAAAAAAAAALEAAALQQ
eukprot:scaffold7.g3681.t1